MSRLDDLPADQRAVLQLVLRQGRSYGDIATTLRLGEDAVRRRAHAGLDALAASGAANGAVAPGVADWLLGQQDEGAAAATEATLARDPGARAWARAVAAELQPLAPDRLPAPPDEPAGAAPPPQPPAADPRPAPPDEPAGAAPQPHRRGPAGAAAEPARRRPEASRRGGALLLALAGLAAVVVLVLVLRGGGDGDGGQRAASASTPAARSPDAGRTLAQVNLRPPAGAPRPRALGVVQVVDAGGRQAINAIVQGLPRPRTRKVGYGMWLLAGDGRRRWLGYFNTADEQGRLVAVGQLDRGIDVLRYDRMTVTRETSTRPRRPGTAYLEGAIARAPARQGSGG
jgi:hypothetical protein